MLEYPFYLDYDKFLVKITVGQFTVVKRLNHGYSPEIIGGKLVINESTCINLTDCTDDRIWSVDHFKECIDRAFYECVSDLRKEIDFTKKGCYGVPLSKYNYHTALGSISLSEPEPMEVYLSKAIVKQLGYDRSKLIKYLDGWYRIRQFE